MFILIQCGYIRKYLSFKMLDVYKQSRPQLFQVICL